MTLNLNEALNEAKTRRGVFSKVIIWESGVSKSQFYRIIKGQETPSAETKTRMAESLGLETSQFDKLLEQSKREFQGTIVTPKPLKTSRFIILGGAAILLCVGFFATILFQKQNAIPEQNVVVAKTEVTVDGDKTRFIADVTIPDGTSIPINTTFVKTWRVQNVGSVTWKDRYLKRMTPVSDLICSSPALVPIPETASGEIIDISVTFKTPHLPGSCRTDWKTSDNKGNLFFPEKHGLYSIVTVVDE